MSSHEQPQGLTDDHGQHGEATMLVREEQLHTGTQIRESGKVRFRKVIVTEEHTMTVTVRHEELRVEHLAATDDVTGNIAGPQDAEHVIILHTEVPVVTLETEPAEIVRVTVQRVTDEQKITETVGKEQIELGSAT